MPAATNISTDWDLGVFVPGRAAPQGSKRHVGNGRMIESSPHISVWREDVRTACLAAWQDRAPLDGPLTLHVEFIRSTEDAITSAGVWADDAPRGADRRVKEGPDEYAAAMLRAADRVALAYRSEDPDLIAAVVAEAVTIPAPPGAPEPWQALIGALAVQVDVDVPWRARFAWTLDVAAVADPVPEPGPSSASYLSASACLGGNTWGSAPSSSTLRRSA